MTAQDQSAPADTKSDNQAPVGYDDLVVVPRRRPWRWVAIVITALVLVAVAYSFVTNDNYEWPVVWQYLFDPRILGGLRTTLILTLVGMVLASVLGLGLAVMRQSPSTYLRSVSGAYVWLFRGTPVLVQLIFWYNAAILVPKVSLGIPFGPTFWSASTNSLINPWTAAILGLSLNEAAYLCEIIRSGIVSVDRGQSEAASALGMSRGHAFRRIVLPQALRVIVPPAANEFLGLLKYSSVVSVIALPELLYSAQLIYGQNYETIPLLLVVCVWYLVVVTILGWFQTRLERRLGVGFARTITTTNSKGRWARWVRSNR